MRASIAQGRSWPTLALGLILAVSIATIGGALAFEHIGGLRPCKLCLWQRQPYYLAMPIALAALFLPARGRLVATVLGFLAALFLVSAGLGAYHAGVEWGYFAGPSDCGGTIAPAARSMNDFLQSLETTRVVSCTQAAWRFLGLSLAGWNLVISLGLAAAAFAALVRGSRAA